jgi:hypothetical protein
VGLKKSTRKVLHLQSLDLVEQIQLDMAISVDEAIAEQLASRGEIPHRTYRRPWIG